MTLFSWLEITAICLVAIAGQWDRQLTDFWAFNHLLNGDEPPRDFGWLYATIILIAVLVGLAH